MQSVTYVGAVSGRDGNYSILFPDFLGCVSGGDTIGEAVENGQEALQFHVETMQDSQEIIPVAGVHTIESVASDFAVDDDPDPDNWVGLFPVVINVADASDRIETIAIRVKADLVTRIAQVAASTATQIDSRAFIERAVEHEIERYRRSAA